MEAPSTGRPSMIILLAVTLCLLLLTMEWKKNDMFTYKHSPTSFFRLYRHVYLTDLICPIICFERLAPPGKVTTSVHWEMLVSNQRMLFRL